MRHVTLTTSRSRHAVSTERQDREQARDEAAIVASISEPARFQVVFERHFGAIHRYAVRRAGAHTAEDVASETFVRAFRTRSSFDACAGTARAWLYGIATNVIREGRRTAERRARAYARVECSHGRHEPPADVTGDRVVESARLETALGQLDPDHRDVVLLVAGAGLSYQEAAAALQVPLGTVSSRMSRARRQLSGALGDRREILTAARHVRSGSFGVHGPS